MYPSKSTPTPLTQSLRPLVVIGSANADIYVEIDRLPKKGETVSTWSGQTLAGGKGADQAACGGKLSYPTYFMGQEGEDAHGSFARKALEGGGVNLRYIAVVMLQPRGRSQHELLAGGFCLIRTWSLSTALGLFCFSVKSLIPSTFWSQRQVLTRVPM